MRPLVEEVLREPIHEAPGDGGRGHFGGRFNIDSGNPQKFSGKGEGHRKTPPVVRMTLRA